MTDDPSVREAILWSAGVEKIVVCALCSHRCRIRPGKRGICGVRENREGKLYTLVYGRLVARHTDPVEKKPLYHFYPGSLTHSIATPGCNMRCANCQNYSISQVEGGAASLPGEYAQPDEVVRAALADGAESVSYTYTEPTIFLEYALDVMKLAKAAGLRNIFVSNGFMTPEALARTGGLLDAANVDLKSLNPEFYRTNCGAALQPVLDTIRGMVEAGVWVEVATLVIPGMNDSEEELRGIAGFLKSVSPDIPWHVTGFHPTYKLGSVRPTPVATLRRAREFGLEEGLSFVYEGNRPGAGFEDTVCPSCGNKVISRRGFELTGYALEGGDCSACGEPLPGRFADGGRNGIQ